MCINKSVGAGGRNDHADVLIVQILFNLNLPRFTRIHPAALKADGFSGPSTATAIAVFETEIMQLPSSDRLIVPGDATIKALLAGLAAGASKEKLQIVMPGALADRVELYFQPLVAGMTKYGITEPLCIAHFIAQLGHESGSFRYAEELADGTAYEGRTDLGNLQPGDGQRYKGRGLIQLTGRANYTAYASDSRVDYVGHPELVATDPNVATDVACWFWTRHQLNTLARRDDVKAVTKVINGGYNGLDDRVDFLGRAKAVLGLA